MEKQSDTPLHAAKLDSLAEKYRALSETEADPDVRKIMVNLADALAGLALTMERLEMVMQNH